jgi:RNA polymerase sigma-70 factor (sigma-E family)
MSVFLGANREAVAAQPSRRHDVSAPAAHWEADDAVTHLYAAYYRSLVRLAALLLRDLTEAEDVVQDAFVAMHSKWRRLREPEKALAYLRQTVVNKSRSVLRHRTVVERHQPDPLLDANSAERGAVLAETSSEVIGALRRLPQRQREVLVLRYYLDLSEAQIAHTLGVSRGAVKSHASRGMSALRLSLELSS